jgi:hypothetical protein
MFEVQLKKLFLSFRIRKESKGYPQNLQEIGGLFACLLCVCMSVHPCASLCVQLYVSLAIFSVYVCVYF